MGLPHWWGEKAINICKYTTCIFWGGQQKKKLCAPTPWTLASHEQIRWRGKHMRKLVSFSHIHIPQACTSWCSDTWRAPYWFSYVLLHIICIYRDCFSLGPPRWFAKPSWTMCYLGGCAHAADLYVHNNAGFWLPRYLGKSKTPAKWIPKSL